MRTIKLKCTGCNSSRDWPREDSDPSSAISKEVTWCVFCNQKPPINVEVKYTYIENLQKNKPHADNQLSIFDQMLQ